jgi:signal transduction histidine kinase
MSIRLRLTLWYSFILTVLLIALGVAIYTILSNSLRANIDAQLAETANQILRASQVRQFSDILQVDVPEELDIFRASGVGVVVIDNQHTVVRKSRNIGGYSDAFDPGGLLLVTPQTIVTRDVTISDSHARVLTAPIAVGDQQVGFLQVVASLESVDESLRQLALILLLGGVIAVLAAALVGAFLARQALRPIDRITQTALAIATEGKLDQRIAAPGPPDEVGRLTKTFNLMLDRLDEMFNAQRRFIADISHELRTPLTTIRGNVDLLRRMGGADPASLDAIRSESDRMIRLVGDLLLLAQADAGLPMRREPLELDRMANEVVKQVQVIAGSVNVVLANDTQAPLCVMGDPDRLRQLMLNLIDNAIKYTPSNGQVKVRVANEGGWARLEVSDTGPGIPPEHLKRGPNGVPLIFERFYRVEKSRARMAAHSNGNGRPGSGTGLGLSIAQWIAQSHAGRIDVQSEIDKGTTFTVWLPVRKD